MKPEILAALAAIQSDAKPAAKALLLAYIRDLHAGEKPAQWGQADHARFALYCVVKTLAKAEIEVPAEAKQALYALFQAHGLATNASAFRQYFAEAKNGALLPAAKAAPTAESLGF